MIDYSIVELEPNEIPNKNVELTFLKDCSLMLCVRFSTYEFENFKKVVDLLSLSHIAYGYETPNVGSDILLRWKNGTLEEDKVNLDCGVTIDIQINGKTIILEFVDGNCRLTQDFTFKQWLRFKKRILVFRLARVSHVEKGSKE